MTIHTTQGRHLTNEWGTASYARTGTAFIVEAHGYYTVIPTLGLELNVRTGNPSATTLQGAFDALATMANDQDVDNYVLFEDREDAEVHAEDLQAQSRAAQDRLRRK